jgi:hypothetical protein
MRFGGAQKGISMSTVPPGPPDNPQDGTRKPDPSNPGHFLPPEPGTPEWDQDLARQARKREWAAAEEKKRVETDPAYRAMREDADDRLTRKEIARQKEREEAAYAGMDAQKAVEVVRIVARREAEKMDRELKEAKKPPVVRHNGTWLNLYQPPPLVFMCPGMIPEGVAILAGKPKGGKSWLVLSLGLAAASGQWMLGMVPAPGAVRPSPRPVLYLALEDSDRRIKDRCRQLGYVKVPELFSYVTQADTTQALNEALAFLTEHKGKRPVIIIDTWGKVAPPAQRGETAYAADYRAGGYLKYLAAQDPGATILVNHHVRKEAAADWIDSLSGTFGIAGSADTLILLTRDGHGGRLRGKGRDVEDYDLALAGFPDWELDGGSLEEAASRAQASADRQNLGDRSTKILSLVEVNGSILTAEVALALGITADQASVYLGRLAKSGKIKSTGRGHWSVGSVRNPGTGPAPYVPPVGSVGGVSSWEVDPNIPTEQTGDTRRRVREDEQEWARMWAVADKRELERG